MMPSATMTPEAVTLTARERRVILMVAVASRAMLDLLQPLSDTVPKLGEIRRLLTTCETLADNVLTPRGEAC